MHTTTPVSPFHDSKLSLIDLEEIRLFHIGHTLQGAFQSAVKIIELACELGKPNIIQIAKNAFEPYCGICDLYRHLVAIGDLNPKNRWGDCGKYDDMRFSDLNNAVNGKTQSYLSGRNIIFKDEEYRR